MSSDKVEIREGGLNADDYALNDFTQEMLDHPGAEIISCVMVK